MQKQFIIQYNPNYSLSKMFDHFEQAMAGERHLQPDNVVVFHDLATIYSTLNKARLDILTFLIAKKPESIYQLTKLLKRHYAHVWTDCQVLANLGIIKLERKENTTSKKEEVKPIPLYEEIVFNFPVKKVVDLYNNPGQRIQPAVK